MGIPGEGLARKVPGLGTILGHVGVRAWVAELKAFGLSRLIDAQVAESNALKTFSRDEGFDRIAAWWHYGRTQISLQMRLYAEQVFSDMGKPWSDLISGFGPIRGIIRKAQIKKSLEGLSREGRTAFTGFKRTHRTRQQMERQKTRYRG